MQDRPKLLLHVCCGPCATAVIERLILNFDIIGFWHNPNIQPAEEHDRRLTQAEVVAREFDIELVVEDADEQSWLAAVAGYEGEPEGGRRCPLCFEHRLRTTAAKAAQMGVPNVATTLSISPHKPVATINEIGERVARALGVHFRPEDFKKRGGFQRSVQMSKQLGLYRQNYCGCLFSKPKEDAPGDSSASDPQ